MSQPPDALTDKILASGLIFEKPHRVSHLSAWNEHIPFAFWIVAAARPACLVELGTHAGVSFAAFCQAAHEVDCDMRAIAVDTWTGDPHTLARSDAYEADLYAEVSRYFASYYPRAELWRMTFDEATPKILDGTVDLLHIDGLHTYDAVRHDFETWRPKLSDRAIVLFHDSSERRGDFGVWRFWEEISNIRPSFEFVHGHGLGVLAWGSRAVPVIEQLVGTPDQALQSRVLFERLGQAISAEIDLRLSEERRLTAEANSAEHLRNAERGIQTIHDLINERDGLNRKIDSLTEAAGGLERELVGLRADVHALNDTVSALKNSTSWKLATPLRIASRALRSDSGWQKISMQPETRKSGLSLRRLNMRGLVGGGWILAKLECHRLTALLRVSGGNEAGRVYCLPAFEESSGAVLLRLPDQFETLVLESTLPSEEPQVRMRTIGKIEALCRILGRDRLRTQTAVALACSSGLRRALEHLSDPYRPTITSDYSRWVQLYDTPTKIDLDRQMVRVRADGDLPKFSIVTPVYNTPPTYLKNMIQSVRAQTYSNWELCISDDCSTQPQVREILSAMAREEPRVRLTFRSKNGNIAAASNTALSLATGDFVALLDHDDELPPHALATAAKWITASPNADIFYSDEDKLDQTGKRFDPFFKPDWNEELLYAQNYVSHLGIYRMSLLQRIGGFRLGYEGSQDYDLVLRASGKTQGPIIHIPHILYHWRVFPGAQTFSSIQPGTATNAARRAIQDRLASQGTIVTLSDGPGGYHRLHRPEPSRWPKVTVIVPTRDQASDLRACVSGLLEQTDYPEFEIIIVDNDSIEEDALKYLREVSKLPNIQVITVREPFNFSRLNNIAAKRATGEVLLMLNNDISVTMPGWLKEMVVQVIRPEVGAVGAKLLYPDHTIQHGGVVLGMGGVAGHVHRMALPTDPGYFARLMVAQEVSCVTGACLALRRSVFEAVGGLDEMNLAVAFNDVDLCLRIRSKGYKIIWTPHAELIHWESKSRGADTQSTRFIAECDYMLMRWEHMLRSDPFFNLNLDLNATTPRVAFPPRIARPWE